MFIYLHCKRITLYTMSSRATKNTNPSVAFFQMNGREIKCFCNQSTPHNIEPYKVIEIAVTAFEQWLDENGYLNVQEEIYASADDVHNVVNPIQWSYTIDEFLHSSSHSCDINALLSLYINELTSLKNK